MDDEFQINIRCPYCHRVFVCAKAKIPDDKRFFNAKCPYCEEGVVLSPEALLKALPRKPKK